MQGAGLTDPGLEKLLTDTNSGAERARERRLLQDGAATQLLAAGNALTALPPALLRVWSLHHIDASNNQIETVADSSSWPAGRRPRVQALGLAHNRLTSFRPLASLRCACGLLPGHEWVDRPPH